MGDDPFFGAPDGGVDLREMLALIGDEAEVWPGENQRALAGVDLVLACGGHGIAVSCGTCADVGDPVALVRRALAVVGGSVARIGLVLAIVCGSVARIGHALAIVGGSVARIGHALAIVGGSAFVGGVRELQAGGLLVDQLGVAVERRRTPMPLASDSIARQPLVAICGGASPGDALAGVLSQPLGAVGMRKMVVGSCVAHPSRA